MLFLRGFDRVSHFFVVGSARSVRHRPYFHWAGNNAGWETCNINSQAALVRLIRYHEGEYVQLK